MVIENLFRDDLLQMFADGGEGGETGGMGVAAAPTANEQGVAGNTAEQPPAAEESKPADDDAAFDEMVKKGGKFARQYNQRVKAAVDERMRKARESTDRLERQTPIMERLAKKYGVKADDFDALTAAMDEDDPAIDEEAMKRGLTKSQYLDVLKIERENQAFRQQRAENERRANAERIVSQWRTEGEQVKAIYPGFQFDTEMENEEFSKLLKCGVNVRTAYEVIHKDDIIPAAMQYAAKTASSKLAKSVAANQARPVENGMGAPANVSSVSQMSSKDIKDICERVSRGERISF